MSAESSPVSLHSNKKEIIWKEEALECIFERDDDDDDEMMHVISLINADDVGPFIRWADVADSIHFQDSAGNTVLHWAAVLGNTVAVTHLIFLGVNIERKNHNGASPLHCATVAGHQGVMVELLRHGADAFCKNNEGHTFFDLLQLMGRKPLAHHCEHLEGILLPTDNSQSDNFVPTPAIDFTHREVLGSLGLFPSTTEGAMPRCFEGHDTDPSTRDTNERLPGDSNIISQQALWGREVELLCALEAADRNAVAVACWEEFTSLLVPMGTTIVPKSCFCSSISDLSKRVAVVLGERYTGGQGERMLLVGFEGQPEGAEFWVLASRVAHSPVVMRYLERFDRTCTAPNSPRGVMDMYLFGVSNSFEESGKRELPWEPERLHHGSPLSCTSSRPSLGTPPESPNGAYSSDVAGGYQMEMFRIPLAPIPDSTHLESIHTGPIQRQLYMSKTCPPSPFPISQKTSFYSATHTCKSSLGQCTASDDCTSGQPQPNNGASPQYASESVNDSVKLKKKPALDSCAPSSTNVPHSTKVNINEKVQSQPRHYLSTEDQTAYEQFLYNSAMKRLNLQKIPRMKKNN